MFLVFISYDTAKPYDSPMYQNQYSLQRMLIQVVPPKPIINKTLKPTSWLGAQYVVIHWSGSY